MDQQELLMEYACEQLPNEHFFFFGAAETSIPNMFPDIARTLFLASSSRQQAEAPWSPHPPHPHPQPCRRHRRCGRQTHRHQRSTSSMSVSIRVSVGRLETLRDQGNLKCKVRK